MRKVLYFIMLMGILAIGSTALAGDCNKYCASEKTINEVYQTFINGEVISHREYADFYINGLAWRMLNYKQKRNFAIILSCWYCYNESGTPRCVIYDDHTGKKLAKDGAFGFKVY